jgi:hypothetical protein
VIGNHERIHVFIGLGVGKGEHHAVAVDRGGKKLFDNALPNDEGRLREILTSLAGTAVSCSWLTSPRRSAHSPSRWPRPPVSPSDTFPGWPCAESRTCTRARRKPTPGTAHHRRSGPDAAPHPALDPGRRRTTRRADHALRLR